MKKVTAFIGTRRRKATYLAVKEFEASLKRHLEVDFEYLFLDDYHLEFCRGCKLCFDKGEERCPLKDDRDALLAKIAESDGVVFATPNYAFQVTARMKNFLERIAFVCHRPRYFGKVFTAIVTQGFYGGDSIRKYLEMLAETLGFRIVRGSCVTTLDPITERQREALTREMQKAAERFYPGLLHPEPPAPSLFRLVMFRLGRTGVQFRAGPAFRDYHYYKEMGWFESEYFYDTSLGPVKKLAGYLFDFLGKRMAART